MSRYQFKNFGQSQKALVIGIIHQDQIKCKAILFLYCLPSSQGPQKSLEAGRLGWTIQT